MLTVPVRHLTEIKPLQRRPEILASLRGRAGYPGIYAFDLDQTLLHTYARDQRTTLTNRPIMQEVANVLERGEVAAIITGNNLSDQWERVAPPLLDHLKRHGHSDLIGNFHFFADNGASRLVFGPDGKIDQEKSRAYCSTWGFKSQDLLNIRSGLEHLFPAFQWTGTGRQRIELKYYQDELAEPLVTQITVKAFASPEERADAAEQIREMFAGSNLAEKYQVDPSAGTSAYLNRAGVSKALPIRTLLDEYGLPLIEEGSTFITAPVFYFGDQFTESLDRQGRHQQGNDLDTLNVPNVIGFAINRDQRTVPFHERLFAAGSGPEATPQVLRYFAELASQAAGQPAADLNPPPLKVPTVSEQTIEVPEQIKQLDFARTAIVIRTNSLLGDPDQQDYFLERSLGPTARESRLIDLLADLLAKKIRVILLSRGEFIKQFAVAKEIELFLGMKDARMRYLSLISAEGISQASFWTQKNPPPGTERVAFSIRRAPKIKPTENAMIIQAVDHVFAEYIPRLERLSQAGDQQARLFLAEIQARGNKRLVETDFDATSIAINFILPSQRSWFIGRLREALAGQKTARDINIRGNGREIRLNHGTVNLAEALWQYGKKKKVDQFLFMGTDFYLRPGQEDPIGRDMEALEVPGLIALAFNQDQDEVTALGQPGRVIAAGSGSDAAYVWLKYLADNIRQKV